MAAPTAAERRESLVRVLNEARGCVRCPLSQSRTQVVFGAGNADADLMFVGEAPGANEDQQGLPFVGRAGKLLDELLADVGLARSDTFVANALKCRPPGNRDPRPDEIEACRPYLERQIELIEPVVIATLGNFATKLLTRSSAGITRVRGVPQEHELGARQLLVLPLFHPAAALRTPAVKEQLRADLATVPALLAAAAGRSPAPVEAGTAAPSADQLGLFG